MMTSGYKTLISVLVVSALAAPAGWYFWPKSVPLAQQYEVESIEQRDLTQTVSANGTLNPVVLVSVGTQVSGVVRGIHADFNDHVEKDQVLLELDPSLLNAKLRQSEASLASASASVALARANEKRTRQLVKQDYMTSQELDTAVQALQSAMAQLAVAGAQSESDRVNLSYTVIRSPVSGVVVSREVDVGQTVAASFQTPTLFKIAQDLTLMQIDSSFAEADIGLIRVGQRAEFTVDAYPGSPFSGVVRQIRLNPTTQSNVVTYNVVIDVNNADGRLLPGMTAYVNVTTAELKSILCVPNTALRFRPARDVAMQPDSKRQRPHGEGMRGTVYLLGGKGLISASLILGASDGVYTQVLSGELKAGAQVVIDTKNAEGKSGRAPSIRIR